MRAVLTLGTCDPVQPPEADALPGDVTLTQSFEDEGQLLGAWARLVRALDPDALLGYNTFGFDMAYMWTRAKETLGVDARASHASRAAQRPQEAEDRASRLFCADLGRVPGLAARYVEQRLSSSALGDNVLKYLDMQV